LAGFNEHCNFRGLSERKGGALHGQLFWLVLISNVIFAGFLKERVARFMVRYFWLVILKRKDGAPLGILGWF
jgi:hypothetical protein